MATRTYDRSILDVVGDLVTQFPTLLRKEGQLARVEMTEKIGQVGAGLGLVVGGAVLLIPALVILLQAAVAAIERAGLGPAISALIVGGAVLVIGLILLLVGVNRMKVRNLLPDKTINQLQEDTLVAKGQMRSGDDYQRAA